MTRTQITLVTGRTIVLTSTLDEVRRGYRLALHDQVTWRLVAKDGDEIDLNPFAVESFESVEVEEPA